MELLLDTYRKLARAVIVEGVNLQRGERLVLRCPVEAHGFATELAETAYKYGAKDVQVHFDSLKL